MNKGGTMPKRVWASYSWRPNEEFKAALFSIMFSIQRTRELVQSFFQLPSTKYAAEAL